MQSLALQFGWLLYAITAIIHMSQAIKWWGPKEPPAYGLPADPDIFLRHPEMLPRIVKEVLEAKRNSWCKDCIRFCLDPSTPVRINSILGRLIASGWIEMRPIKRRTRIDCIDLCSNDATMLAHQYLVLIEGELLKYRLKKRDPRRLYVDRVLRTAENSAHEYLCYERDAPQAVAADRPARAREPSAEKETPGVTERGGGSEEETERGDGSEEETQQRQQRQRQQWGGGTRPRLTRTDAESGDLGERIRRVMPGIAGLGAATWRLLQKGLF